jgi:hypothetical protein
VGILSIAFTFRVAQSLRSQRPEQRPRKQGRVCAAVSPRI